MPFVSKFGPNWDQDGDGGLILRWYGDNNPIKLLSFFWPINKNGIGMGGLGLGLGVGVVFLFYFGL